MPTRVAPLNAKQLEAWRPDPTRTLELVDGATPGLRVRLSPAGEMVWSLSVRVHGVRRRIAIGKGLRLAEARRKAEQMRQQIADGNDPTAERKTLDARRKAAAKGFGTLGNVITSYYENGPGKDLLSGLHARVMIERVFKDHLGRPALDVSSAQLQLTVDAYQSRSSAAHAALYISPVMRWAIKRGLMTKGDALEAPRMTQAVRQRALTHDEAGKLWKELSWHSHDAAARFMLLTAARREEVCGLTWREINLDTAQWTLPAARRKDTRPNSRQTKNDHVVPLPRQGVALLERLERGGSDSLVFSGQRNGRLGNWPRWSKWAERRLGFIRANGGDITPHALRRTCATLAGDLGVAPHVVSALLGHRSIGGSLLAGYNQSRYTREVGVALQMVADLLDNLAAGDDNIVIFRVTA
jgi:integrase